MATPTITRSNVSRVFNDAHNRLMEWYRDRIGAEGGHWTARHFAESIALNTDGTPYDQEACDILEVLDAVKAFEQSH